MPLLHWITRASELGEIPANVYVMGTVRLQRGGGIPPVWLGAFLRWVGWQAAFSAGQVENRCRAGYA